MNEKNFDIYLEFNFSKLNLSVFNKLNGKIEYYKEQTYKSFLKNYKEINFNELEKFLEKNILELEKSVNIFVKDVYLIVETPQSISIELSLMKNNEGQKIVKQDAMYMVQDARQQIIKSNPNFEIIHIIVENYILDNIEYKFLPLEKDCKNFSIDIKFVCFPKNFVKNFEKLFFKQQISINKFICLNYVKSFQFENNQNNICENGRKIAEGINKQEVVSVPKTIKKRGFFEKMFHFFK